MTQVDKMAGEMRRRSMVQLLKYPVKVSSFYRFAVLSLLDVERLEIEFRAFGKARSMHGLVLLGVEGINGTVSGSPQDVREWEETLRRVPYFADINFKNSVTKKIPYRHWKIQVRQEIVTIGDPSIHPKDLNHRHLAPEAWDQLLREKRDDVIVLDTRNIYETEIGKFSGAIIPEIEDFKEFPKWIAENPLPKNKKIMIYCTGGIRCEKAIFAMERQGYKDVVQLQGGILNYLSEKPNAEFEGECFVFDRRVAVQQNLLPTEKYLTCPHCGQTATEKVDCQRCDSKGAMCLKCETSLGFRACSKNCAYHLELNPSARGRSQGF